MRPFALMFAALTILAGAGQAQAQFFDSRGYQSEAPSFFGGGGASPIPRTTVDYPTNYAPGTMSAYDNCEDELSFDEGQIIEVFGEVGDDGYFVGELNGRRGLVPEDFLDRASNHRVGVDGAWGVKDLSKLAWSETERRGASYALAWDRPVSRPRAPPWGGRLAHGPGLRPRKWK